MSAFVLATLNDATVTAVAIVGLLLGVFLMARGIRADALAAPSDVPAPPPEPAGPTPAAQTPAAEP
ncbi:MAG: peptidoglycan-binding protein, partial [Solirubrobacteraceae bacterium]